MKHNSEEPARPILLIPAIDEQDIHQEAELLKLQGITPSLKILRRRAQSHEALLTDFDQDLPGTEFPEWALTPEAPEEVIEGLVHWALNQSALVSEIILAFLESPDDESYKKTLRRLTRIGAIQKADQKQHREAGPTLADLILRYLEAGPRSLPDLYSIARNFSISRRPEAAIRQAVRRLNRKGLITISPDKTISLR